MKKWTLNSWAKFPAKHLPNYVDKKELDNLMRGLYNEALTLETIYD